MFVFRKMQRFACYCRNLTPQTTSFASAIAQRHVSLSAVQHKIDPTWREARGLPDNPNSFGPLTNLPDYTFLDGRPTPMGSNQRKRLDKQKEIAAKMVEYCAELDFAKERTARMKADEAAKRQEIMDTKLKPKGHLLLKKK